MSKFDLYTLQNKKEEKNVFLDDVVVTKPGM
jgi:hypothetical protein